MQGRRRVLVPAVTAVALLLAACGSGDDNSGSADGGDSGDSSGEAGSSGGGAEGTLRVLVHQNPPMVAFMEEFNAEFEEANPNVSVDMAVVSADELGVANQTRLSAGEVDVTTITIGGFANPVQDYMTDVEPPAWQTLVEAGLLMDLSGEDFVSNYNEQALEQAGSYDGGVYSVSLGRVAYSGMFVNQDLLSELGVEVPTTWDELVSACETIKESGNNCMTVGGADTWPIFVGSYGLLGSYYPDQEGLVEGLWTGDVQWDDDQTLELWRRYQTYSTEFLEEGVTGLAHDAAIARYAAGDVAFAPTGTWQAPALEQAGPEFEWTYVPFPGSDDAADNELLFGKYDQGLAIAEDTPNREAAVAYVAALSEPEAYNRFVNAVGFLPTQDTATLDSRLGEVVAPLLENYRVGFEQWWVQPAGAGQWANGSQGPAWFAPYNEWEEPEAIASQAQQDLEAGLGG